MLNLSQQASAARKGRMLQQNIGNVASGNRKDLFSLALHTSTNARSNEAGSQKEVMKITANASVVSWVRYRRE